MKKLDEKKKVLAKKLVYPGNKEGSDGVMRKALAAKLDGIRPAKK